MPNTITVIDRVGQQHSIEWEEDQALMEALRDNNMEVLASCGGTASCASLGDRSEDEIDLLNDAEGFRPAQSRLSCQVPFEAHLDGITVELAPEEQ